MLLYDSAQKSITLFEKTIAVQKSPWIKGQSVLAEMSEIKSRVQNAWDDAREILREMDLRAKRRGSYRAAHVSRGLSDLAE
jgi:hypothetical protein